MFYIGFWLSAGVAQAKVAVPFQDSIRRGGSSTEASMSGYGMEGEHIWLHLPDGIDFFPISTDMEEYSSKDPFHKA